MYKSHLDAKLQSNFSLKAIFLYGQSSFFIDYYQNLITLGIGKDASVKTIYFEEYDFDICRNFLNQPSLFNDKTILVIKTQSSILKKELTSLIQISTTNPNAYLIISYYENKNIVYQREKKIIDSFVKNFSKIENVDYVRFFKPNLREGIDILSLRARYLHLSISPVAIKFLYESLHENLDFAYKELEKLSLLDKDITNEDIKEISSNLSIDDVEEIFINILDKKPFLLDMKRLLEHTIKDIEFIGAFCNFISNLILFNIFIKENGYFDSKAIMGVKLPRHIEEKRAKLSIKFKLPKYTEALVLMQEIELELKTNKHIDARSYLYSSFSRFQKRL